MKLNTSNETLAENKLVILYILDKIGKPVYHNELMKIVISITHMNYFYFQQFILDLLTSKYICNFEKDKLLFYEITSDGKEILKLTNNIIPGIVKLNIDTNIKSCQQNIKNRTAIVSEFEPEDLNNFYVDCKIIEDSKTVFSIKILANSREQAQNICDNWKKNANKLYSKFINELID